MPAIRVERYSTDSAPHGDGLAFWNGLASETFNNLVVDAPDRDGFRGEMVRAPLGRLSLMSADSTPACVKRINDPERVTRASRTFDLHYQLAGRSLNIQSGREAVLEAGEFTLCDASQPYSVQFTEANHMICLKLPADMLATRISEIEALVCRPMPARRAAAATLSSFVRTVWDQLEDPGDEAWGEAVSRVILDLVDLAYRPLNAERCGPTGQDQMRDRARAHIDERLCDPELGVGSIAEALGVSPRYIQMLFAGASTTPSAYILERRLKLAAERLRGTRDLGVTDVAMGLGFNDLTHFGRVFRRRFGVAPRDYRAGVRNGPWAAKASALSI